MPSSFEEFEALVLDQVHAIVAAELAVNPTRAARYGPLLAHHLVTPRVIGCQPAVNHERGVFAAHRNHITAGALKKAEPAAQIRSCDFGRTLTCEGCDERCRAGNL